MLRVESLPADVLGLSELSRRALSGRLDLEGFPVARSLAQIGKPEERFTPEERAHLARWLEAQLSPLGAHVHVLESARAFATPGASCVITGHQPGFLCSPLLILYKAVQCIALSKQLTEHWQRPVVPVFWNHADDHDLAEVHHAHFLNRNFDLQKAGLAGLSSGRHPLSRIRIDRDKQRLPAVRALFRHIFGDYPRIDEALESFMPENGMTFAGSFTRNLLHLFGKHGLIVVEPHWFREESSSALAQVVSADPAVTLAESESDLIERGLDVAIPLSEAALVYRVDSSGRHPLRVGGEGFRYDEEPGSRTRAELAAEIVQEPTAWSAGALLRPIVQDMILPVAAQVGGHGELAYHAQLGRLRQAVCAPCTPFVPRVSMTLVEVETRASSKRVGASPLEILRARGQWTPAGEEHETPAVLEELRRLVEEHAQEMLAQRKELAEVEPSLAPHLRRAVALYKGAIEKLAEKAARARANRTGKGGRHLRRLNNTLCPRGEAQEKVLAPLQFVARFGTDWLDSLIDELDPFCSEHLLVDLEEDH